MNLKPCISSDSLKPTFTYPIQAFVLQVYFFILSSQMFGVFYLHTWGGGILITQRQQNMDVIQNLLCAAIVHWYEKEREEKCVWWICGVPGYLFCFCWSAWSCFLLVTPSVGCYTFKSNLDKVAIRIAILQLVAGVLLELQLASRL